MKNSIILILICLTTNLFGQVSIPKDTVFNVDKNKDELYANAKMVIAESFKSAQDVIQNDDKENYVILVKGSIPETITLSLQTLTYYFKFTTKIYIKDSKCRIIIDNVYNSSSPYKYNTILINEFRGTWLDNLTKKKHTELMSLLENDINLFVNNFIKNMQDTNLLLKSDW